MRTIGVVTTSRADYGIYKPILKAFELEKDLNLYLMVSGTHLSESFGMTVNQIKEDGFKIDECIEILISGEGPETIVKSMSLALAGFSRSFTRYAPDILVVLGDRYEMYSAAVAAVPFNIPLAHIHGGELTEGAIDDALRHSLTKLSHLHFVSTENAGKRVMQMGEEPWRVTVSGAPSLDNLGSLNRMSKRELENLTGISFNDEVILVTFHPTTLEYDHTLDHTMELLTALETLDNPIVFTRPNGDTHGQMISNMIDMFVQNRKSSVMAGDLGTEAYFSLMLHSVAMVGNSSSGIIEAPSFGLPVVNIGTRQKGRERGLNVIDVGVKSGEILDGIKYATDPTFRRGLIDVPNPYGNGSASQTIIERLKNVQLNRPLIMKRFVDIPPQRDSSLS